ncbi:rho GTPase-activating protein 40 [Aplochiton taeniatus]
MTRLAPSRQFPHARLSRFKLRPNDTAPLGGSRNKKAAPLGHQGITRDPRPTEMNVEPWVCPHQDPQAAAEPAPRTRGPSLSTVSLVTAGVDQDQDQRPDKLCLDSFWSEVETIRQGTVDSDLLDGSRRDSKQSDEGEQEEQWLQDAGVSTLIGEDSEDDVGNAVLLSTLTRTQAAAVQRRLESYTLSLRKRSKAPPRDVREVFSSSAAQTSSQASVVPAFPNGTELGHNAMETGAKTPLSVLSPDRPHGLRAPKEEIFITDVAYCEQAVILLKQAKLPQHNHRRRDDGTLPRVVCPQCRLGVTRVQDLSPQDLKKVRQLALIDMTALCDLLELDVKRHKTSKRKIPESALFGVPLATLLENDQKVKPHTTVPLILQALLSFLEKRGVDSEGILRVPGSQSRIKFLQQNLESHFYSGDMSWEDFSPNDVAALLKKFIRDLPSPLLTSEHLNAFSAVKDIGDLKQKLHMLNLLVLLLPEPNRNTLKALLEFLNKVVVRERRNRMNLWAVSTIMAPNLFLHKAVPSRLTEGAEAEKGQVEKAADIMRLLIHYRELLWTIPNFLMSQVRKLNENNNRRYQFYDRRLKNLLRKIGTDSRDKPDKNPSEPCRTVKIQVGDEVNSTMEVQVNVNYRASDLLAKFHRHLVSSENSKGSRRNSSINYPDCAIYELGGNIGEHRLDPETHLLDLYNSNPGGEWVIKLKPAATRGV